MGEGPGGGCVLKRKDELLVRQTARQIGQPKSWEKTEKDTHIQTIKIEKK